MCSIGVQSHVTLRLRFACLEIRWNALIGILIGVGFDCYWQVVWICTSFSIIWNWLVVSVYVDKNWHQHAPLHQPILLLSPSAL